MREIVSKKMQRLLDTKDVASIVLQYLNPNGMDIINFKLVCSYFKELVEIVVPLHHIISIFQCIVDGQQILPSLYLPSDFILHPSGFDNYFLLMKRKLQQEHFSFHIITKFLLLYHNNPM